MDVQVPSQRIGALVANRYTLIKLLGEGGWGEVYLARDEFLDGAEIAIKMLHRSLSRSKEFIQRFLREVQAMRMVSHPNVVRTFEAGESGGDYFYTMEFLRGQPLSDLVYEAEQFFLNWTQIKDVMVQTAQGLDAIHSRDLVHRDLKLDNIFLDPDGGIKITDFGLVRTNNSALTQADSILGTLRYIAPESWNGAIPTKQSDLYALGVIFHEICLGFSPFEGENPVELMQRHLSVVPTSIKELRRDSPPWADPLLFGLLEKDPTQRIQSAKQVIETMTVPEPATKNFTLPTSEQLKRAEVPPRSSSNEFMLGLSESLRQQIGEESTPETFRHPSIRQQEPQSPPPVKPKPPPKSQSRSVELVMRAFARKTIQPMITTASGAAFPQLPPTQPRLRPGENPHSSPAPSVSDSGRKSGKPLSLKFETQIKKGATAFRNAVVAARTHSVRSSSRFSAIVWIASFLLIGVLGVVSYPRAALWWKINIEGNPPVILGLEELEMVERYVSAFEKDLELPELLPSDLLQFETEIQKLPFGKDLVLRKQSTKGKQESLTVVFERKVEKSGRGR